MAQSAEIRHEVGFLSTLPLGSIIAWHRDLLEQGALSLPPGWVECNGQILDDPESPFNGHVIPNLNLVDQSDLLEGREGGAFLRGAPRSGELQQDELQTHTHQDRGHRHFRNAEHAAELAWRNVSPQPGAHGVPGPGPDRFFNLNQVESATANLAGPTAFGAGAARHGAETRPVNMSVIWIMKVKQITAAQALPAVLAHEDSPQGAVFVDQSGRVGIGTDQPSAELQVAGGLRLATGATVRSVTTTLGSRTDALATEKAIRDFVDGASPLRQGGFGSVEFTQEDPNGTEKAVEVGFTPQLLFITGRAQAASPFQATSLSGGPINGFAEIVEGRATSFVALPMIDVSLTGSQLLDFSDEEGTLGGIIVNGLDLPILAGRRGELQAKVSLRAPTESGFVARLEVEMSREIPVNFTIKLHFLCMA